ncbi:hypothetical protein [Pseudonocardia sp. TRM90224]|uniref:hypothetical protein n=1 Tax=Pseudonocardia sp. TRM90224 TaxID=2812678 RepID=UPI001E3EAEDF|nr:hypothetical protein [Pseudonocardia sp. TRM90224]
MIVTDPAHGGRWTSLLLDGREWLWRHPDPAVARARLLVAPGAEFVDAGGVEECFPTVRGVPDHGDVWTRPWYGGTVRTGSLRLAREIDGGRVAYEVTGPPGTPFVHAVHALLDVSPSSWVEAPGVESAVLLDGPGGTVAWPSGLDRLGPDDGTAVAALLPGCSQVTVVDGPDARDRLRFRWRVTHGEATCSLLVWRNLRGWPAGAPYRSIGIEPMLGTSADLSGTPAELGADGRPAWEVTVDNDVMAVC